MNGASVRNVAVSAVKAPISYLPDKGKMKNFLDERSENTSNSN